MSLRRSGTALLLSTGLLAGLAGSTPALAAPASAGTTHTAAAATSSAPGRFLVRVTPGAGASVAAHVVRLGGSVQRHMATLDLMSVELPEGAAPRLGADPQVLRVTADAAVSLMGKITTTLTTTTTGAYNAATDSNSLYNLGVSVSARNTWTNTTGAGIDVAVLDSGVVPVKGLDEAGKIVYGPDLTPESQSADTRNRDTYGHGTHMAGIIAGHDAGARVASGNTTDFLGVAPDARIVSVKVADAHGNTDVSQVIAGIDWVVQHRKDPGMNIRVLNLSFGTDSAQPYQLDPLAYAAEVAWRNGIVVVVSAGNTGDSSGRMTLPATDPYVIAVGAADTRGTTSLSDDVIPAFSSRGTASATPTSSRRAPTCRACACQGRPSTRPTAPPGPSAAGSSAAAAPARRLRSCPAPRHSCWRTRRPRPRTRSRRRWPPARGACRRPTARRRARGSSTSRPRPGSCRLRPGLRSRSPPPRAPAASTPPAAAPGSSSRGSAWTASRTCSACRSTRASHAASAAAGTAWTGGSWNGSTWAGDAWSGTTWSNVAWTGRTWAGSAWAGRTWASGTWDGRTWAGTNWSGSAWAGSAWAGRTWAGRTWADNSWS